MKNITVTFNLKRTKHIFLITALMCFIFSFAQTDYSIVFQDELIDIPENISSFEWNQMPQSAKFNNSYYGWVQFYETPDQETQDLFKAEKLQLIEYVSKHTYSFCFPETSDIAFLKEQGVRGIVPAAAVYKISSALQNPPYEYWAKDGENVLISLQHHKQVSKYPIFN